MKKMWKEFRGQWQLVKKDKVYRLEIIFLKCSYFYNMYSAYHRREGVINEERGRDQVKILESN